MARGSFSPVGTTTLPPVAEPDGPGRVSKLKSKLRRILGVASPSGSRGASPARSSPGQPGSPLRPSSTNGSSNSLDQRPGSSTSLPPANGPASPQPSSARARLRSSTSAVMPTPAALLTSCPASVWPQGPASPAPPSPGAPLCATPRSSSLRRAVSFGPNFVAPQPASLPSPKATASGRLSNNGLSANAGLPATAGHAAAAGQRTTSGSGLSHVAQAGQAQQAQAQSGRSFCSASTGFVGRGSGMLVVPEDQALPESSEEPGAATASRATNHLVDFILRSSEPSDLDAMLLGSGFSSQGSMPTPATASDHGAAASGLPSGASITRPRTPSMTPGAAPMAALSGGGSAHTSTSGGATFSGMRPESARRRLLAGPYTSSHPAHQHVASLAIPSPPATPAAAAAASPAPSPFLVSPTPPAGTPPPIKRGTSAYALLPPSPDGRSGPASPMVSPDAHAASSGPTAVASPSPAAAAGPPPQPPVRRSQSTVGASFKPPTDASSGQQGSLMALGVKCPEEMKRRDWKMDDYTLLKRLYKGNYSAVHKALCRVSMRLVVVKVYDTTRMTDLARNHVKREAAIHSVLEHENILDLFAVFSQGPYVVLIEEVAEGGDLYHVLKGVPGHRLLEDRAVAGVIAPLLRTLSYLHERGILHRDIKLENILFSDRHHTHLLLADFGIALSLRQERAVTRAGTTEYMSPEQLKCPFKRHPEDNKDRADLYYGAGVDVWATGVMAFELLHGYPPFLGSSREETESLIVSAPVTVAPQLSSGARDFLLSCLQKDPSARPTVPQLLQHAWIRAHARQLRVW